MSKSTRGMVAARGEIRSAKSMEHADARTQRNRDDQRHQRWERLQRREEFHCRRDDIRAVVPVHESLGLEFVLDRHGRDLSVQETAELLRRMKDERACYWATRSDRPGKKKRLSVAKPLEYLSFAAAPWHSLALTAAAEAGHRDEVLKHLKKGGMIVAGVIERVMGWEVVSIPLHPKKFATHWQPNFVKVNAAGELVGTRRGLGKAGKSVDLGKKLLGAWRLREAGFDLSEYTFGGRASSSANLDRSLISRRAGGQEPLDIELAKAVDGYFETLKTDPKLGPFFARAWEDYRGFKRDERVAIMDESDAQAAVVRALKDASRYGEEATAWRAIANRLAAPFAKRLPVVAVILEEFAKNPEKVALLNPDLLEIAATGYKLRQWVLDAVQALAADERHADQCRTIAKLNEALEKVVRVEQGRPAALNFHPAKKSGTHLKQPRAIDGSGGLPSFAAGD